jgi:hypothetical protein
LQFCVFDAFELIGFAAQILFQLDGSAITANSTMEIMPLLPFHSCRTTVHDNRRRRTGLVTTEILDFAFWPKTEAFSVRLIKLLDLFTFNVEDSKISRFIIAKDNMSIRHCVYSFTVFIW